MATESTPSQSEIVNFLSQRHNLTTWPQAEVEKLAQDVKVLRVKAGDLIFDPSYQADDAYLVYTGQIRQSVTSAQGVEWWHRTLPEGEFFTQQALFRGASYASTARAELDTVLLHVSAAVLSELLGKHPDLWVLFYTNTAARLQAIPLLRSLDDHQIERLSVAAVKKSLEIGDLICTANQADSSIYLIDRGQVRITQQMQTEFSGGGQLIGTAPTPDVVQQQGFADLPHLLTAGNYFVGGLMRV
ncbi:MAG TPA: cyclic nucleotide-binding domain-containing protein, partial [Anaerolineae bacterium]|nr:cyclic nucleotide-binding domain-containing protein [Anaerolineae bacterium]